MDGQSLNLTDERITQLKALFPDVVSEGRVDFDRLKAALGEHLANPRDRYELSWAGKSEARKEVQRQTSATLLPDRESSVDFDTSENLFIEGENLEALRVLQKAYFGKVKMIYIDPPYNTGNDSFVYPDDYSERKEEYERRTGIKDEAGYLNKQDLWKKNTKESGQFHSVWLSMMYPRLYLSRNLLREDGVIFVSIDDNEQGNLKLLMDEVFGEENKLGLIIWKNSTDNNPTQIAMEHEYLLVYAKDKNRLDSEWKSRVSDIKNVLIDVGNDLIEKHKDLSELQMSYSLWHKENKAFLSPLDRYKYIDFEGVYIGSQSVHNPGKEGYRYDVVHPETKKPCKQPLMGYRFPESTMEELLKSDKILFGDDESKIIELKVYAKDYQAKLSSIIEIDGRTGSYDLKNVFPDSNRIFNNPKPTRFLNYFFPYVINDGEIVLDFFAGSASTAHAVLELNAEDGGNRKFILVQLPEATEEGSEAHKAGYRTIADISKARVQKVIERIKAQQATQLDFKDKAQDLGFKAYRVAPSNFKVWQQDVQGAGAIATQLGVFQNPYREGTNEENMLYELMLKSGL